MKKSIKRLIPVLALSAALLAGCSGQNNNQTASSVPVSAVSESSHAESTQSASSQSVTPSVPAEESSTAVSDNSAVSQTTSQSQVNYPSYLVGKWSLSLDTTQLDASAQADASNRMENTAIVLNANGTATGISNGSTVQGEWGESGGYVYITLGTDTEYFQYYVDTLVSMNYQGMSFVR